MIKHRLSVDLLKIVLDFVLKFCSSQKERRERDREQTSSNFKSESADDRVGQKRLVRVDS